MKRKIIEIDRELCNGCAQCTTACAEGALELDAEGKAFLAREIFCDGLGACLDVCPTGALKITEREAPAFDEAAANQFMAKEHGRGVTQTAHSPLMSRNASTAGASSLAGRTGHAGHAGHAGCPGSMARSFAPASAASAAASANPAAAPQGQAPATPSELSQWPIQLHLVSPQAPYFRECDLLIAADCTAFALGSFHLELLRGKALAIACPKLDKVDGYVEKLTELIAGNTVYSITVAIMEVPCCTGLSRIVSEAVERSGKSIAIKTVIVGIDGSLRKKA